MTGEWVSVGPLDALPPGAAVALEGNGDPPTVAVFNVDGELCAVEGACPHRGGPLAEGMVRDGVVSCPRHWFRFDLRTGEHVGGPELRLRCYPVRVVDGMVEVCVPPAPPPMSWRDRLLAAASEWKATASEG